MGYSFGCTISGTAQTGNLIKQIGEDTSTNIDSNLQTSPEVTITENVVDILKKQ